MFFGREKEIDKLNQLYKEAGFQMPIIYGRRRVGKTRLIQEFCKDKETVFFVAIEQNDKEALRMFSEIVLRELPGEQSEFIANFDSWDLAFRYIGAFAKKRRIILAIDEYPYLAGGNPSISSILQNAIDHYFADTRLYLILCGSSMSFMENQVLDYKSPLYGRRTAQIKLEPLDYCGSIQFLSHWNREEQLMGYGLTGGIPQYLLAICKHAGFKDAVIDEFLSNTGSLFEEPVNLIKQEMREPAIYNSIIRAIAEGASRQIDISNKIDLQSKSAAIYLKSLIDLSIIEKEYPYGELNKKRVIYKIKDQMFRFWYKFIPTSLSLIEMGLAKVAYDDIVAPRYSEYFGFTFEEISRQFLIRMNKENKLGSIYHSFGRWWGTNPITKNQEEIDLVGSNSTNAIFAECKWKNEKLRLQEYEQLVDRSKLIQKNKINEYYLFSKSGFTQNLTEKAKNCEEIHLIGLNDLFSFVIKGEIQNEENIRAEQ